MATHALFSFHKKTRKGKVIKLTKEKYLMVHQYGYLHGNTVKFELLSQLLDVSPNRHLLIVDTNICLHEIDVLEYKFSDVKSASTSAKLTVIVLQTVLEELRHLNLSCFRRLVSLINDESKQFIMFPNDFSRDTIEHRCPTESINDFNDRKIRNSVLYFSNMLQSRLSSSKGKILEAVLITNDKGNQARANGNKAKAYTMKEYVEKHLASTYPHLLDVLSSSSDQDSSNPIEQLSSASQTYSESHFEYLPHAHISEITQNLQSKLWHRGVIRCERGDINQCYTIIHIEDDSKSGQFNNGYDDYRKAVRITGPHNINRAVDGDVVAIALLEGITADLHESQANYVLQGDDKGAEVANTTLLADATCIENIPESFSSGANDKNLQIHGRVVGIIRRNWRQYAGSVVDIEDYVAMMKERLSPKVTTILVEMSLQSSGSNMDVIGKRCKLVNEGDIAEATVADICESGPAFERQAQASVMLFVPVDSQVPPVFIKTHRRSELINQRILVNIDEWPRKSIFPWGHYVGILGPDGDKQVETQVLLHEFGVSHESFSAEVMACLPPPGWCITDALIAQRTDLRYLPVVSIDPPGCKDIDDALHCVRLSNGNLQIGVHIADVTHFVHPDTPLDKEASHRSTSTYLVDRRLDMLPSLLTTELCSLRSNEDHLSFSVLWEMDENGNILAVDFCKSVIHSVASLTYDEAQAILDSPKPLPRNTVSVSINNSRITEQDNIEQSRQIHESVHWLNIIGRIIRTRRIEQGALTLASPEVRFKIDSESQNPTDVNMYTLKESNALVEEFMLLANITVSKQILRYFPALGVLRRHQPPSVSQFSSLLKLAKTVGVNIDITTSKSLADSLDKAVKENDPYFNKLLRIMSTRCMKPAQYFCSGEIPKQLWHHYGLAAPVYTHFTSPIRRYADIIVHRLLAASIGAIPLPPANSDRTRQQELCTHMNRRHRAAQYVQRASVNLHTILYFKNSKTSSERAYALLVNPEKIVAFVPRFALEGSIYVSDILKELAGVEIEYDDSLFRLIIRQKKTGNEITRIQVFQQMNVVISVSETVSGHRQLVIRLKLSEQGREETTLFQNDETAPNNTDTIDAIVHDCNGSIDGKEGELSVVNGSGTVGSPDVQVNGNKRGPGKSTGVSKRRRRSLYSFRAQTP